MHGVAHPHRRERILAAEREVLGHTFDEPERQRVEAHQSAARRALGDVVLEDVHELVAEHVIVVGVDAGERHDDARASPSVTPPVPSSSCSPMTFVCSKSGWSA